MRDVSSSPSPSTVDMAPSSREDGDAPLPFRLAALASSRVVGVPRRSSVDAMSLSSSRRAGVALPPSVSRSPVAKTFLGHGARALPPRYHLTRTAEMAKSLRSKSAHPSDTEDELLWGADRGETGKRAHRTVKRTDPKSPYHATDALRTQRLAARLKETAKGPKVSEEEEGEGDEGGEKMEVEKKEGVSAEEDGEKGEQVKVSTSGPRMSGREVWKSRKGAFFHKSGVVRVDLGAGVQVKRAPSTVTWKKRTGKPHRRR